MLIYLQQICGYLHFSNYEIYLVRYDKHALYYLFLHIELEFRARV